MVQELRIGNWLLDGFGKYYQVEVADLALLASRPDTKECNPIPLTPEILEKAGFVIDENAGNWHSPDHTIYKVKGFRVGVKGEYIGWYNSAEDDFYSSFYPELKYLHQLQNLVHSLTGEELTINL